MVQRQGTGVPSKNLEQDLMNAALALVERDENDQTRRRRSVDSPMMYIAAKLQQEDDKRLQVTLGDNRTYDGRYYNRPLEKDAAYWTLVVTEKRSGPWTERVCSVPRRFVAAPNTASEWLGLAAGMVAMLVIAALAIVCIKKRHQLRVKLSRDHIVNMPRVSTERGLAPSMVADGEATNNYLDHPRLPTVNLRVQLVRGEWRVVDQTIEDHNRKEPPRGAAVQEPDYLYFGSERGDEEPIYDEIDWLPPVQIHQHVDMDDDYLTPRRLPPGTPSGVIKG